MIFLDESGANLQMAPLYGRGYGGERVIEAVPFNRGGSFTMLSAISFTKVEAALYGKWAADGEILALPYFPWKPRLLFLDPTA